LLADLEALYVERYRQFLRVAIAIVADEGTAHDVVQDGFARAIRSADSYRGEGPLEGWVWRIVVNAARAARRGADAAQPGDLEQVAESPGADGDASEADLTVRAWVAALPERQRLAVFLRYYADLDYRSIAAALEVEVGTVSATLSAAHAALRRVFEEVSG
jgi:RNA polymerase sigma-70 factor (ECF subfamily)